MRRDKPFWCLMPVVVDGLNSCGTGAREVSFFRCIGEVGFMLSLGNQIGLCSSWFLNE